MINVSNEFRQTMAETRTDFKAHATCLLTDNTTLNLTSSNFAISGNGFTDGGGVSTFPYGIAVSRYISCSLMNDQEQFSDYDFYGALITVWLDFQLSSTTESILLGSFTVTNPATAGDVISFTAYDAMWKADKAFNSSALTYPTTLQNLMNHCISACGFMYTVSVSSLSHKNYVVNEIGDGYTYRQIIGYIAGIEGGNAMINQSGALTIKKYTNPNTNYGSKSIASLAVADVAVVESNTSVGFPILSHWQSLSVDTDDISITGVQYTDSENNAVLYGSAGYVIDVSNPIIQNGNATHIASGMGYIRSALVGLTFRKFSGSHIAYPIAEFMDCAYIIDRKHNVYPTIITDVGFQFFGFTSFQNSAESYVHSGRVYAASRAIIEARELISQEHTDRENAISALNQRIEDASGMFTTIETNPDGSSTVYAHDKPTRAESTIVWKFNAAGIGVSNNGGSSYNYGFTVDGVLIASILDTIGINAEWIKAGTISTSSLTIASDLTITAKDSSNNTYFSLYGGGRVVNSKTYGVFHLKTDYYDIYCNRDSTGTNYSGCGIQSVSDSDGSSQQPSITMYAGANTNEWTSTAPGLSRVSVAKNHVYLYAKSSSDSSAHTSLSVSTSSLSAYAGDNKYFSLSSGSGIDSHISFPSSSVRGKLIVSSSASKLNFGSTDNTKEAEFSAAQTVAQMTLKASETAFTTGAVRLNHTNLYAWHGLETTYGALTVNTSGASLKLVSSNSSIAEAGVTGTTAILKTTPASGYTAGYRIQPNSSTAYDSLYYWFGTDKNWSQGKFNDTDFALSIYKNSSRCALFWVSSNQMGESGNNSGFQFSSEGKDIRMNGDYLIVGGTTSSSATGSVYAKYVRAQYGYFDAVYINNGMDNPIDSHCSWVQSGNHWWLARY